MDTYFYIEKLQPKQITENDIYYDTLQDKKLMSKYINTFMPLVADETKRNYFKKQGFIFGPGQSYTHVLIPKSWKVIEYKKNGKNNKLFATALYKNNKLHSIGYDLRYDGKPVNKWDFNPDLSTFVNFYNNF